jgi:hypothetical protein
VSLHSSVHQCLAFVVFTSALVLAQNRVDPKLLHERVLAVVPIVGSGTYADPKRPLLAPGPGEALNPDGIIGYSWNPSDDGKHAIVEFVARDPRALQGIVSDPRVVIAFAKGKAKKDDIEKELKKYRKDFSLDAITGRRP